MTSTSSQYQQDRIKNLHKEWVESRGSSCEKCGAEDEPLRMVDGRKTDRPLRSGVSVFRLKKEFRDSELQYFSLLCGTCSGFGGHHGGEVVGGKTLHKYIGKNSHGHHLWLWVCPSCSGVYGPSTISHLKRAVFCAKCSLVGSSNPRWVGHEDIPGVLIGSMKHGAKKRGLEWSVSNEYLWTLWLDQKGLCAYTGWTLSFGYKSTTTASLDRIDSRQGYVTGNLHWVHKDINRLKSDFSHDKFMEMCGTVAEFSGQFVVKSEED